MPEVDFMVVCDHVRAEGGLLHMIAAGVDRIRPPQLPRVQQLGIGLRLSFTRPECDRPHEVQLVFQDEDGHRVMQMDAQVHVVYPHETAPGGLARAALALNVGIPLTRAGRYSFDLLVGGHSKKSIDIVVEHPGQQAR